MASAYLRKTVIVFNHQNPNKMADINILLK
jgi:hypothetical protein